MSRPHFNGPPHAAEHLHASRALPTRTVRETLRGPVLETIHPPANPRRMPKMPGSTPYRRNR